MSKELVSEITCDLCLATSVTIENKGSFAKGNNSLFFSYQDIDICQHCCFVLWRSRAFPANIIGVIMDNYNEATLVKI